jgi:hypothetical protein
VHGYDENGDSCVPRLGVIKAVRLVGLVHGVLQCSDCLDQELDVGQSDATGHIHQQCHLKHGIQDTHQYQGA